MRYVFICDVFLRCRSGIFVDKAMLAMSDGSVLASFGQDLSNGVLLGQLRGSGAGSSHPMQCTPFAEQSSMLISEFHNVV